MNTNITLPPLKLFINNQFVDAASGKTFPVIQPATGQEICRVAEADKVDVDRAVDAAEAGLIAWEKLGYSGRQKALFRLADLWEESAEELGRLESYNNGGPIGTQTAIIKALAEDIRYFAGWCGKVEGKVAAVDGNYHVYTRKEPIGVCGLIIPWNLPLWCMMVKLAPCLSMGNVAVIKPAEQTPLTALKVAELIVKAGFPPGVVNIVPGYGPTAGAAISMHMRISKVAFTGSTQVGRMVLEASAKSNLKRVQLELGGKSPVVVFPDADLDEAVKISNLAIFTNNGEICTAGSRTYVHEDIYEAFVMKAVEHAKKLKVGNQLDASNNVGPLVDKAQFEKVKEYIELGKKEGAKLLCGGGHSQQGYFVEPTVFADVTDDMTIAREEIFGPVQSIIKFKDVNDVIKKCNASEYGLAAAVVTKDVSNMFAIANNVKAGTVWVNTYHVVLPQSEFGGYKQSGFGREGGNPADEWTNTKTVCIQTRSSL